MNDRTPLRATEYLYYLALARELGSSWTEKATVDGRDGWIVHLVNRVYGTEYEAGADAPVLRG